MNECDPSACQNGGTCIDGINQYSCICVAGFIGTDCESNLIFWFCYSYVANDLKPWSWNVAAFFSSIWLNTYNIVTFLYHQHILIWSPTQNQWYLLQTFIFLILSTANNNFFRYRWMWARALSEWRYMLWWEWYLFLWMYQFI